MGLFLALALSAAVIATPPARADVGTVPWVNLGTVSNNGLFDRHTPTALTDQSGHLYVFYYTTVHSTGAANINVSKYTVSGGLFGTPVRLFDKQVNDFGNTNLVSDSYPISATMDSTGNLYVAWTKLATGPLGSEIYVSKSTDGGSTWQGAVPVRAASANYEDLWPFVATTSTGTVYVAWTQIFAGTWANITIASSTNGANTFSGVTNVSGEGRGGIAEIGPMAIDAGGRIYVAYIGVDSSPNPYRINVTWSDDGTTWATPHQITPKTTLALYPDLIVDVRGRVHLSWLDYRGIFTCGNANMWYTRSDDRGATWIPQTPISQCASNPNNWPYLASHGNEVMAAWTGTTLGNSVLSFTVSTDGGNSWTPERTYHPGYTMSWVNPASDENGTFYGAVTNTGTPTMSVSLLAWYGPPSTPTNLAVANSGTGSLTASWTASPEPDVTGYRVFMSTDGVTYNLVADVSGTSYTATGLANGTYWFRVDAISSRGAESAPTAPVSGTIGPTVGQLNAEINSLQTQITALQASLNTANADLTALQNQLNSLQTQLTNLQNSQAASNAATAAKLAALQQQLNQTRADLAAAQAVQATQTMSYVNTGLAVVIIVLLVLILLVQMRKPKSPQMMMAQPGQAPPNKPDDEL